MDQAIKLAIEKGGYKEAHIKGSIEQHAFTLLTADPLFWQALGKALGWKPENGFYWEEEALRYFRLVLNGGDTEKFWEELLN